MTKTFLLLLLVAIGESSFAQSTVRIEARCEEDSIDATAGRGRNNWAKECNYISARTWDFNVNDDHGAPRGRPYYPSFSNPENFDDWWKAPVTEGESCSRGPSDKYTNIISCLASCYTPDQKLLFEQGELTIFDAFDDHLYHATFFGKFK